jgi:hypothetical protein
LQPVVYATASAAATKAIVLIGTAPPLDRSSVLLLEYTQ